jgi:DNA polymerase
MSNEVAEIARELRSKLELYSSSGVDECLISKRSLVEIKAELAGCAKCDLSKSRAAVSAVVGIGSSGLFIVVDRPFAPTEAENRGQESKPERESTDAYRGQEGEFLKEIITKGLKLEVDDVSLSFVTRCSGPDASDSDPIHVAACLPYLLEEVSILRPKVLLVFGGAAEAVLEATVGVLPGTASRSRVYDYNGIKVVATYGLKEILTDKVKKGEFWNGPFRQGKILKG